VKIANDKNAQIDENLTRVRVNLARVRLFSLLRTHPYTCKGRSLNSVRRECRAPCFLWYHTKLVAETTQMVDEGEKKQNFSLETPRSL
jgi:hypothetical protein